MRRNAKHAPGPITRADAARMHRSLRWRCAALAAWCWALVIFVVAAGISHLGRYLVVATVVTAYGAWLVPYLKRQLDRRADESERRTEVGL